VDLVRSEVVAFNNDIVIYQKWRKMYYERMANMQFSDFWQRFLIV